MTSVREQSIWLKSQRKVNNSSLGSCRLQNLLYLPLWFYIFFFPTFKIL